jgi:RNA polymerase sigma factor (sigma-70 family)
MSALTVSPRAPACSEHDLVARARAGDDRAFEELYARYGRRIVSYVFGMVGDHGRAEDITQDVFISALRRMRDTERPIAFKPWIYEIARNACIDEFRRSKRVREVPLATDDEDPESADRRLVSRTPSPDAMLERHQQLDDLRGAFRGLSDNHHKLIVMRELEGLSYDEIGKRMGMTRPVVESTLFRARRRLNDEYQEIASGRRCEQVQAVVELGAKSITSLGIKERRRVARHLSHCQPCRRFAWAEGLDDSVFQAPSLAGKIAALLPIPAFLRWRRGGGGGERDAVSAAGSHSFSALQTVQSVVQYVDPTSPAVGLGRAAAAVAAVVVAGGGVVGGLTATSGGGKPQASKPAIVRTAHVGSSGSSAASGNQPRVGATKPQSAAGALSFSVASPAPTTAKASSTRSTKTDTGAGSSNAGSSGSNSLSGPTGTAAATRSDNSGSSAGGSGTSIPGLPNVPLPSTPSLPLPQLPLPSVPPVNVPQINIPGTVQNTVNGASNTVSNVVNTLNGIL